MRVEGALGHLFPALDGHGDIKAAGVARRLGLLGEGVGDHLAGNVIDGGFAHGLVEAGLCHPADTRPAEDADAALAGPQGNGSRDGQACGDVGVIAAVFFNGTDGAVF